MRRRGFILVLALILCLLIVVIGLGFLGMRRGEYEAGASAVAVAEARSVARAGMEDAKVKLAKDQFFPTGVGDEQLLFSYTEDLPSITRSSAGSYQVTVDRTRKSSGVVVIESVGTAGSLKSPRGRYAISAELDLKDYRFKNWNEGVLSRR